MCVCVCVCVCVSRSADGLVRVLLARCAGGRRELRHQRQRPPLRSLLARVPNGRWRMCPFVICPHPCKESTRFDA
jgi:hypothetical protein